MTPGLLGHVVGVRLRGSSQLRFFDTKDSDIRPGSWVLVLTESGQEPAQVVIAPQQMLSLGDEMSLETIVLTLTDSEIDRFGIPADDGLPERDCATRQIGGVGFHEASRDGVSRADAQYRRVKQELPRLGQRVETGQGRATVVALDVSSALVTIRYDETGEQEIRPANLLDFERLHLGD